MFFLRGCFFNIHTCFMHITTAGRPYPIAFERPVSPPWLLQSKFAERRDEQPLTKFIFQPFDVRVR